MLKSVGVNINPSGNRKWLLEDFTLKKNTIDLAKIVVMKIDLDHTKFIFSYAICCSHVKPLYPYSN